MSQQKKQFYDFDDFRLDVSDRLLFRRGEILPLTQKAFEVLLALVERKGQVVEKEELRKQVWGGSFVEEGNLTQNIYTLRKILGQASGDDEYIQTIPRRGYRFAAPVSESFVDDDTLPESSSVVITTPDNQQIANALQALPDASLTQQPVDETTNISGEPNAALKEPASPQVENIATQEIGNEAKAAAITSQAEKSETPERQRKLFLIAASVILVIALIGIGLWFYQKAQGNLNSSVREEMTVTALTSTGNIQCTAISPDGKYVATAIADKPHQGSLWLTQLSTNTQQQIIAPTEARFFAVSFSRSGDYLYYVLIEPHTRVLYRIPLVGGTANKLIEGVDSAVAFSPDGNRMVFRRVLNARRETALFTANLDGSDEQELAAIKMPETFADPAWSPDGKLIACGAGRTEAGVNMYVIVINVADKSVKQFSATRWNWIGQMGWLTDGSGLLMVAGESAVAPYQLWRLAYPTGEARRITNDANYYNRLSLSADGQVCVAMQRRQATNLWLASADNLNLGKPVKFGTGGYRGDLSWTPDGKLVFDSDAGNATSISVMNSDGSDTRQLTGELTGRAYFGQATVSPDGRYIVYASDMAGALHLWRMNRDGSNPLQLTNGEGEENPDVSPDGEWVIYTKRETRESKKPTTWKVSIDGGEPQPLIESFTAYPAVSPDGKLIACIYAENYSDPGRIALFPIAGGEPIKIFPTPVLLTRLRWTPDGRGIAYSENPLGTAKILMQFLDKEPPEKLLEFENDRIFGFAWSRDGKALACVRGIWAGNVVLIKNFKTD
ncbi:MAG: winged helix-turn-helix domain-containing protein [Acidobacteriota bacterium]